MILKQNSVILSVNDFADRNDGCLVGSSLFRKKKHQDNWIINWSPNPDGTAPIRYEKIQVREVLVADHKGGTEWRIAKEGEESSIHEKQIKLSRIDRKNRVVKRRERSEVVVMSHRTKAKIKDKINAWHHSLVVKSRGNIARVQFNMLTLTLTEKCHDKRRVYSALNYFFTLMRSAYGRFNYLWVAEIQEGKRSVTGSAGTGNLHFHCIVDRYFPIGVVNGLWLRALASIALKTKNEAGKPLNPCDVKNFRDYNVVSNYVRKYITKNDSSFTREPDGSTVQLWNCSQSISRLAVGIYRVMSIDSLAHYMPRFDGVFHCINNFISIHTMKSPPRGYMELLSSVWVFNVKQLNIINHGESKTGFPRSWKIRCLSIAANVSRHTNAQSLYSAVSYYKTSW